MQAGTTLTSCLSLTEEELLKRKIGISLLSTSFTPEMQGFLFNKVTVYLYDHIYILDMTVIQKSP